MCSYDQESRLVFLHVPKVLVLNAGTGNAIFHAISSREKLFILMAIFSIQLSAIPWSGSDR